MEAPIPDELAPEPVRPLIRHGLAKAPEDRPASAADFVTELEAVATAGYGEDWEERGQRKLAALAVLLLLLFPSATPGASGTTALATTTLGAGAGTRNRRSLSRRGKALAGLTAVALAAGALTVSAVAAGNRSNARSDSPRTTEAHSSVIGFPSPTGPTSTEPSESGTPKASTSATTDRSPTPAAQSNTNTASGGDGSSAGSSSGGTSTSGGTTGGSGTTSGTTGGASAGSNTPGGSSGSGSSTAPGTTAPPQLDVVSVTIEASGPLGSGCAMVASVTVRTNGAADGTMMLTWFDSTSATEAGTTVATDPVPLPKGKTQISGRYTHTFSTPDPYPYLGVKVATSPAADSGNGSITTITAPSSCNPIR